MSDLATHPRPAQTCRERGWGVGDVLAGDDGRGRTIRIRVTAIGREKILALRVDDGPDIAEEQKWRLDLRAWERVDG